MIAWVNTPSLNPKMLQNLLEPRCSRLAKFVKNITEHSKLIKFGTPMNLRR